MKDQGGGRSKEQGLNAWQEFYSRQVVDSSPHSSRLTPYGIKGFTLLEVMVAVAILAMVLVTLLGVKNNSTGNVMLADHMTTATLLAKRMMNETLTSSLINESEDEGAFDEEEFKDYTWHKTISPLPIEEARIMEIRVAVLWKESGRQEQVELKSYE